MLKSGEYLQARNPLIDMQLGTHAIGTQLHLLAHTHRHTHATPRLPSPNRLDPGVCSRLGVEASGNGVDVQGLRLVGSTEDLLPSPLGPIPHEGNRQDLQATERGNQQRACGHASHLFRAEASRGFTNFSRGRLIRQPTSLARGRWIRTEGISPPLPLRGEGCAAGPPP